MMKPEYELISFHVIEKFHNTSLITWTYPNITPKLKEYLLKSLLKDKQLMNFVYVRLDKQWIYIWEQIKEQKFYAIALVTQSFNPTKYKQFGSHLCKIYEMTGKPIELVRIFLDAFTNGSYKVQHNGTQCNISFADCKKSENEVFQELINLFGVEIILIYNAILLKKRIFVYHADIACLLKHIEAMIQLVDAKRRDPNEYLYPCIQNVAMELKGHNFFLAGVTDKNINVKQDTYDLFVNLQSSSIKISPNSRDVFQMTKWHKDIATLLMEPKNDSKQVELHKRTADLFSNLNTFALTTTSEDGPAMVTLEALREKKLPSAMENFLFNLAVAENIMML